MPDDAIQVTARVIGDFSDIEKKVRSIESRSISLNIDSAPLGKFGRTVSEFEKSMDAANARVVAFAASASIIGGVTASLKDMVSQSIQVEKALADINVIAKQSGVELQGFSARLSDIAKNTGTSFLGAADAARQFTRQGAGVEETLKRTNAALTLSRLSGIGLSESVETITASMNSFKKEGLGVEEILNRIVSLEGGFSVSTKDLAESISRVGTSAQDAKISFNQLIALVTSAQQITSRGGAVISNAIKTITTKSERSGSLDELENLGVAVRDLQGKTLPAITILQGLAKSFDTLGESQKSSITEMLGGIYQVNTLKAVMSDLSNQNSVYARALNTVNNATDEATRRNAKLNQTLSSLFNEAGVNFTSKLAPEVSKNVFEPAIRSLLDSFNGLFDGGKISEILSKGAEGILKGIGNVLSGPGLIGGGFLAAKLLINFGQFAKDAATQVLGIGQASEKVRGVQENLNSLISRVPELQRVILDNTITQAQKESLITEQLNLQIAAHRQIESFVSTAAPNLVEAGFSRDRQTKLTTKEAASGYIPIQSIGREHIISEVLGARHAGYSIGPEDVRAMHAKIGGKEQTVVYNSKEKVINDFAGTGEPAIIPPVMNSAKGQIPNFVKAIIAGTRIDPSLTYLYDDNFGDYFDPERQAKARERGYELINPKQVAELVTDRSLSAGFKKSNKRLRLIDPTGELKHDSAILSPIFSNDSDYAKLQNVFDITSAKSPVIDKFQESQIAKGIQKSGSVRDLLNKYGLSSVTENPERFLYHARHEFGNGFYVKGNVGSQSDSIHNEKSLRHYPDSINKIDPDNFFIQSAVPNIRNREFRVHVAGNNGQGELVSGALQRGKRYSLSHQFINETNSRDLEDVFGALKQGKVKRGGAILHDILSRKIAETQALNTFNSLPSEYKSGTVIGADVIETGHKSLVKKALQLASEKLGLSSFKGGGVVELNFSQDYTSQVPGSSGGLARSDVITGVADALKGNSNNVSSSLIKKGKKILGLSGDQQSTHFDAFQKELSEFQQYDEIGYLKTASALSKLGFGVEVGRGNKSRNLIGEEARNFFATRGFASGFIPLAHAISRETNSGISSSLVRIGKDSRLSSSHNPSGLGVYNMRDEPLGLGQGISRAISEGRSPKTYNVPNFARDSGKAFREKEARALQIKLNQEAALKYGLTIAPDSPRQGSVRGTSSPEFRNALGHAAFTLPFAGGFASEFFKPNSSGANITSGVSSALGAGATVASIVPGAPGLVIGGVIAAFGTLKTVLNATTGSLEKLQASVEKNNSKKQRDIDGSQNFTETDEKVNNLINSGAPKALVRAAQRERSLAISKLSPDYQAIANDPSLKPAQRTAAFSEKNINAKQYEDAGNAQLLVKSILDDSGTFLKGTALGGAGTALTSNTKLDSSAEKIKEVLLSKGIGDKLNSDELTDAINKSQTSGRTGFKELFNKIGLGSSLGNQTLGSLGEVRTQGILRGVLSQRQQELQDQENPALQTQSQYNKDAQGFDRTTSRNYLNNVIFRERRNITSNANQEQGIRTNEIRNQFLDEFDTKPSSISRGIGTDIAKVNLSKTQQTQALTESIAKFASNVGIQNIANDAPEAESVKKHLTALSLGDTSGLNDFKENLKSLADKRTSGSEEAKKIDEMIAVLKENQNSLEKLNVQTDTQIDAIRKTASAQIQIEGVLRQTKTFNPVSSLSKPIDFSPTTAGQSVFLARNDERFDKRFQENRFFSTHNNSLLNFQNVQAQQAVRRTEQGRNKQIGLQLISEFQQGILPTNEDISFGASTGFDAGKLAQLQKLQGGKRDQLAGILTSEKVQNIGQGLSARLNPLLDNIGNYTRGVTTINPAEISNLRIAAENGDTGFLKKHISGIGGALNAKGQAAFGDFTSVLSNAELQKSGAALSGQNLANQVAGGKDTAQQILEAIKQTNEILSGKSSKEISQKASVSKTVEKSASDERENARISKSIAIALSSARTGEKPNNVGSVLNNVDAEFNEKVGGKFDIKVGEIALRNSNSDGLIDASQMEKFRAELKEWCQEYFETGGKPVPRAR